MAVECRPAGDCAPARREGPFYHVGDATGGRAGARTKEEDEDGGPPRLSEGGRDEETRVSTTDAKVHGMIALV